MTQSLVAVISFLGQAVVDVVITTVLTSFEMLKMTIKPKLKDY